jgi:hypothetical protein
VEPRSRHISARNAALRDNARLCYLSFYSFYLWRAAIHRDIGDVERNAEQNARTWSSSATIATICYDAGPSALARGLPQLLDLSLYLLYSAP